MDSIYKEMSQDSINKYLDLSKIDFKEFKIPKIIKIGEKGIFFEKITNYKTISELMKKGNISQELTKKIAICLGEIHTKLKNSKQKTHSDFRGGNILVKNNQIYIIDFEEYSGYEQLDISKEISSNYHRDVSMFLFHTKFDPSMYNIRNIFTSKDLLNNKFIKRYEYASGNKISKETLIKYIEIHIQNMIDIKDHNKKTLINYIKKIIWKLLLKIFIYLHKPQMKSYRESHVDQGAIYEKMYAKKYDKSVRELEKEMLHGLFKHIDKDSEIMDFACGTGRITILLEKYFNKIDGIDVAQDMIDIAKTKTKKTSYLVGDITNNLDLSKKYDIITAFRFFLNAEDELREDGLRAMLKYLKKDGKLIFSNHGNKPSLRSIKIFLKKIIGIRSRNNELSQKDVETLLNNNGMKIADQCSISFLPQLIYKILPKKWAHSLEKRLQQIPYIQRFAIDIIYIATHK